MPEPVPLDAPVPPDRFDAPSVFRTAGAALFVADGEAEGEGDAEALAVEDTETDTEGEGVPRPGSPAPVSPPAAHPAVPSTKIMAAQGASPRAPPALTVSAHVTDAS
ncbi:hypothetical protein [Streptomyces antibioticus]|uniref:hypothetical protein n=1 Tax=Streptomyces antibioticus TaxID=1890 RepID=UPI0022532329|nr:hypothetical protein [Streptomyces antibioticus]MCX5171610.1 hypothetical protein [Streptomyces antibioticus]